MLGNLAPLLGSALTVYAIGRFKDEPKVSHVGIDLIQSLALSRTVTRHGKAFPVTVTATRSEISVAYVRLWQ